MTDRDKDVEKNPALYSGGGKPNKHSKAEIRKNPALFSGDDTAKTSSDADDERDDSDDE